MGYFTSVWSRIATKLYLALGLSVLLTLLFRGGRGVLLSNAAAA